jgi:hypothetical protein
MAYPDGGGCTSAGNGKIGGFNTTFTGTFSSPSLNYPHIHPVTNDTVIYSLGTAGQNSVSTHQANDQVIRAFASTPSDLVIADTMSLDQFDFADFLATNSVVIESGFRVHSTATLRISVGSHVLAKRGIDESADFIVTESPAQKSFGMAENFSAEFNQVSKTINIFFEAPPDVKVSLAVYDLKAVRRGNFGEYRTDGNAFSKTISMQDLPSGQYFFRVLVGPKNIYRKFWKQ